MIISREMAYLVAAAPTVMIRRGDKKQEIRLSYVTQRTGKKNCSNEWRK